MKRIAFAVLALNLMAIGCSGDEVATTDEAGDVVEDVASDDAVYDAGHDAGNDAGHDAILGYDIVLPEVFPPLADNVDPAIGSRGQGNVFIGASVPHGMVKLGPDTNAGIGAIDGYAYENDRIDGFTHTHLQGPGGSNNGYSQVLITAMTGAVAKTPDGYGSAYSHDTEVQRPGMYSVNLDSWGIKAEMTATRLAGFHRYTFGESDDAHLIMDLSYCRGAALDGSIEVLDGDTIEGYGVYQMHPLISMIVADEAPGTGVTTIYFSAKIDKKAADWETWPASGSVGANLDFSTTDGEAVNVRVGISYISVEQARANREADLDGRTFEEVAEAGIADWNRLFWRVDIGNADAETAKKFYTAMYHALLVPADYTEDGRFWSGWDGTSYVNEADGWRYYTDNWCIWDTFRTTHPLLTIVQPEVPADMVQSLVHAYEEGGWMPKCPWNAAGDSRVMTGNFQFCVVADAMDKGLDDFDLDSAWAALKKGSDEDIENAFSDSLCGMFNQGTPPEYVENGFVPLECDPDQATSLTLEHATCDWCVARFAELTGRAGDAQRYAERAKNYEKVFNPAYSMMQSRNRDGSWEEPFDPLSTVGFTEADSWQYTWFVPHDVCGLVDLMGGAGEFKAMLGQFFDENHFVMENEPDFHAPWLWNFVGDVERTSEIVRDLVENEYSNQPDGIPGNDDAGATSSWLIFAMAGLYPVMPGDGRYYINVPVLDHVMFRIDPERRPDVTFSIDVEGRQDGATKVASAFLNDEPFTRPYLTHDEVTSGGTLRLVMGATAMTWDAQCE